jgi:hypothetical protein
MKRTQIYRDAAHDTMLEARAHATGTTKSALIHDAIDAYLGDSPAAADSELRRLRTTITDAAGIAPHLPAGEQYVEDLRAKDAEREADLVRRRTA